MQIIYSSVFKDFLTNLSDEEKKNVNRVLSNLESITTRIEIEEKFQLVKTRKLDSLEKYTYMLRLNNNTRLIFRIESDILFMDNIIFKNSLLDKYLNTGGDNE